MPKFKMTKLVFLSCVISHPVAASWTDLWQRQDQQLQSMIDRQAFDEAAAYAESADQAAQVQYKSGAFDEASKLYEQANDDYNQGTSLIRAGDYNAAIEALSKVSEQSNSFADASHNLEIAKKLAELQQEQPDSESSEGNESGDEQQEQQDGQQQGESDQSSSGNQDPAEENPEPDASEQPEDNPEENNESEDKQSEQESNGEEEQANSSQQTAESPHDESKQTMDQWLQQVPDDPAGLLKSRIYREHRRNYAGSRDKEQAW